MGNIPFFDRWVAEPTPLRHASVACIDGDQLRIALQYKIETDVSF